MRGAGILYPIFSLSSPYGMGTLSKEAYEFIDFLKEAGPRIGKYCPLDQRDLEILLINLFLVLP